MQRVLRSCLAIILAGFASVAGAQDQQSGQNDPIIVNGEREVEERVAKFVDAVIQIPKGGRFTGQFARLAAPICPAAFGFSKETGTAIVDRMRAIAKASDIQTEKIGCSPNIFLVVVTKGSEVIHFLRKRHHNIFGQLPLYRRDKIERSPGPVYGWRNTYAAASETGAIIGENPDAGMPTFHKTHTQSLIKQPVEQQITTSFLLIEEDALIGLTTTQIADFAALYLLLESDENASSEGINDSILTLFNDRAAKREPAESITEWDLMLLHAWYAIPTDLTAIKQRAAILRIINDEIVNGPKTK